MSFNLRDIGWLIEAILWSFVAQIVHDGLVLAGNFGWKKDFYYFSKQKQHKIADRKVFINAEEMLNVKGDGTESGPTHIIPTAS